MYMSVRGNLLYATTFDTIVRSSSSDLANKDM